jgi:hypothetical protein
MGSEHGRTSLGSLHQEQIQALRVVQIQRLGKASSLRVNPSSSLDMKIEIREIVESKKNEGFDSGSPSAGIHWSRLLLM